MGECIPAPETRASLRGKAAIVLSPESSPERTPEPSHRRSVAKLKAGAEPEIVMPQAGGKVAALVDIATQSIASFLLKQQKAGGEVEDLEATVLEMHRRVQELEDELECKPKRIDSRVASERRGSRCRSARRGAHNPDSDACCKGEK